MATIIKRRKKKKSQTIVTSYKSYNPETGKSEIPATLTTVEGTKKDAEAKIAEMEYQKNHGGFVKPNRILTGEWLDYWLDFYILKDRNRRLRGKDTYRSVIKNHLIPHLGNIPLQQLDQKDIFLITILRTERRHFGATSRNITSCFGGCPRRKKNYK